MKNTSTSSAKTPLPHAAKPDPNVRKSSAKKPLYEANKFAEYMVEQVPVLLPQQAENDAQKPELCMDGKLGRYVITELESLER